MKRFIVVLLATILVGNFVILSYAKDQNIVIKVNDNILKLPDAQPFIDSNQRTQVPVRFVSEALGANVDWDNITKVVTIKKGNDTISLKIGESLAKKNDQEIYFDTILIIKQDRTFVPLRFVSEALGAEVEWYENTKTISIVTEKKIPEDYKKILNVIPNSKIDGEGVIYSADGKAELGHEDFSLSKDRDGYDVVINLNNYNDTTVLNEFKKIIQIYYPISYEKVYNALKDTIKNDKENNNIYFDDRSFDSKKFSSGISIYIGKKGVKYTI